MNRIALAAIVVIAAVLVLEESRDAAQANSASFQQERSIAAFREVATVLQSPRCMNCHSAANRPRQGDDRHLHAQNVMRGPDGKGLPGLRCSNCHQETNHEAAGGPPGASDWHMPGADQPMAWEGLSVGGLCRSITDPNRNGHRQVKDVAAHMDTSLVVWAWSPGPERTPPPLSYDQFMTKVREWIDTGAACEK